MKTTRSSTSWFWAIVGGVGLAVGCLGLVLLGALRWYWAQEYPIPNQAEVVRATTPPMGWNSWNAFGCSSEFTDKVFRTTVDRLVADGYVAAGYKYVVIDDCWQVSRDAQGTIQPDRQRFPEGIKPLADYAHQKGLLFGIYTSAGRETCEGRPGSYGFEAQDIATYESWGVDYIKLDWCGVENLHAPTVYATWRRLLDTLDGSILLNISLSQAAGGQEISSWLWGGEVGDSWRTTTDIHNDWGAVLRTFDLSNRQSVYQRVGGYNDADMLVVGNGGMTFAEQQAHLGLWSIMSTPLMISADLREILAQEKALLLHKEAIAINQDPLGIQGTVLVEQDSIQVVAKPLKNRGNRAVLLVNRGEEAVTFRLQPSMISLHNPAIAWVLWPHPQWLWLTTDHEFLLEPHSSWYLTVWGLDTTPDFLELFPRFSAQVQSGNVTRQVAQESSGLFEYDAEYQLGRSLGVKNDSRIRYHLNGACQKFTTTFTYVATEGATNPNLEFTAKVYLDGRLATASAVSAKNPTMPINLELNQVRVLDLTTSLAKSSPAIVYGRWVEPAVACLD